MAMRNRTGFAGLGLRDRLSALIGRHKKGAGMAGAAAGGFVMASSYIFGGVAPFGVAFCAALKPPYAISGALGAVLGYIFTRNPLANMKYLAAVLLVAALQWLFGGKLPKKWAGAGVALTALVALGTAGVTLLVVSDATLYDGLLTLSEVFLGAGAAYFFHRALFAVEMGWENMTRADSSCLIVSFAVVVMGLSTLQFGGVSVGRTLCVLVILLCARAGAESGGAVAGITAGVTMGLCGGDYAYAISAYGFGGLMAGVFGGMGRIATAAAFIAVNLVAALFTKSTTEVYAALLEVFVASVAFMIIPQSAVRRFRPGFFAGGGTFSGQSDLTVQNALRARIGEIAGALREIGATTREVGHRLGKLEGDSSAEVYNRVAERVCNHCGNKTTCWQFQYNDTMNAISDAMLILKREGTIGRARMPKHFSDGCCKLDEFVTELNTQFSAHVAKEGAQRKVSRVRGVMTDQFEGMAMMMEEVATELCDVTLLDASSQRRVEEHFAREGFDVRQVRCYSGDYDRITAEITLPAYEAAKLPGAEIDLSGLLEAEMDLPYLIEHEKSVTAIFNEKATFRVELGAHQILPSGNRLCGDAYEVIPNRAGHAHYILSDGMGSGGSAAVDAHMASQLLARLISVGFSHGAALKMVNSALLVKSGDESLATVDICSLDLYTGRASFFKAGAAPSFVVRGGRVGMIESTSLPAGILQGVAFDESSLTLRESDIVVLLSDGVVSTGADWVKSELSSLCAGGASMQRIAEQLAMMGKIRRLDDREDDITVLALSLQKGI